jgi:hypothetical protein
MLTAVTVACTLALAQDPRPAVDRPPEAPAAEEFGRAGAATEPASPEPSTTSTPDTTTVEGPAEAPAPGAIVEANGETKKREAKGESKVVPPPQWKGNGLLVTAGVLGTLGLGANIARIAVVRGACEDVTYDPMTGALNGTGNCRNQGGGLVVLGGSALGLNLAALGTAAAGSSLRGTWAAHDTAYRQGRRRASGAQIGVGAGLLAAGVIGYAVVRVVSFADVLGARSCQDRYPIDNNETDQANSEFANCVRNSWSGYLAGITVTQSASIVGAGLLAHGASYRRNLKFYRAVTDHQVRLAPTFAPTFAGAALTARF